MDRPKDEIAKEAGCGIAAVYRYSHDPEIIELVRHVREDVVDVVAGMFVGMLPEAAVHLKATITNPGTQPAQRISALRLLFEVVGLKNLVVKEPEKGAGEMGTVNDNRVQIIFQPTIVQGKGRA